MAFSSFKNGVHPSEFKTLSCSRDILPLELPDEVFIPLQQHIGAPCESLVKKGDRVKTGQIIGSSKAFVSAPVHASVTGKVKAVDSFHHPLGMKAQMVHIKRSGDDDWALLDRPKDWRNTEPAVLRNVLSEAGIVGMGGAAFPTHVKMAPPAEKPIDAFILNGCECEPWLTSDHRSMLEYAGDILTGAEILMSILGVSDGYIGIEDNKLDAVAVLQAKAKEMKSPVKVLPLKVKYPQGAEKMLIEAILKRKVPTGGLPMDVGAVVNNVGTAIAAKEAIIDGKALVERVVTITGDAVAEPGNVRARIGTSFRNLIEHCGGLSDDRAQVFMGGPMMGITQWTLDVPVVKATSGIVASRTARVSEPFPCIRCGTCVSACPMFLLPTKIARLAEMQQVPAAVDSGLMNCIECGSCAFDCPSNIPLVQWIRVGKMRAAELRRKEAV